MNQWAGYILLLVGWMWSAGRQLNGPDLFIHLGTDHFEKQRTEHLEKKNEGGENNMQTILVNQHIQWPPPVQTSQRIHTWVFSHWRIFNLWATIIVSENLISCNIKSTEDGEGKKSSSRIVFEKGLSQRQTFTLFSTLDAQCLMSRPQGNT